MSSEIETRRYELRKRADSMEENAPAHRRRPRWSCTAPSAPPARRSARSPNAPGCSARPSTATSPPRTSCSPRASRPAPTRATPWPDPARWRKIADPAERLATGLEELYAYHERNEALWSNVLRDETLRGEHSQTPLPTWSRAYLDEAASRARRRLGRPRTPAARVLLAAARHAVDFRTWRSLARDGGVSRAAAVDLASAMVTRAAAAR